MSSSSKNTGVVLGLMIVPSLVTLAAVGYQMWNTRETAWNEVAPSPAAATPAPAPPAGPTDAAPAAPPDAGAPASQQPGPAPGRSAQDFSAWRPEWEATLKDAQAQTGQQLAQQGLPEGGVQACVACHGAQGVAQPEGAFPSLAGLSAEYIAKQLMDYREGSRTQALMTAISRALSPDQIGHLAVYYAGLPTPAPAMPPDRPESARELDMRGDNARALPACANCHGLGGRGEGVLLPRLAGQPPQYFIAQMNAFRDGQRRNDDAGVMQAFAQRLTPQEIEALAQYYASGAAPR